MSSLLLFGFFIGMRHALEADHLAAVAAISTKQYSLKASIRHGAVWGLGHTTTLFLFGTFVIFMNTIVPPNTASLLELMVGVMLFALGLDVLRRMIKQRIHYHIHNHTNSLVHFHAHSHAGETSHKDSRHKHNHEKFPYRIFFIGMMHGLAGSAALILLTQNTMQSFSMSILYIILFGVGSIVGMATLSMVISVPLRATSKLTYLHNGLQFSIGVLTIGLGSSMIYQSSLWSAT